MGQNEVKIVLTTDASGAVTGFKTATGEMVSFGNAAKDTDNAAKGTSQSIVGLTKNVAELTLGLVGVKSAVDVIKGSLNYLGQIETATLGIGSSFMVSGKYVDQVSGKVLTAQASLKAAQEDAKQTMAELQVANFQTIATLDQLVRGYQETLPVAMSKGFDRQQVKEFIVTMVQAAGAIGLSLDQLGEETRSMLTGTINPRTSRIATVLGLTNEDIRQNSQNAQKLFDFLMGKLDAYKIAGIEAQNTWGGLMSNTKDIALQVGGQVFRPLFDSLKYEMKLTLDSLVSIDEKTKTIKWNQEFLTGVETFRKAMNSIIAEFYRMGMLLDKIGGTLTMLAAIPAIAASPVIGDDKWKKLIDWNMKFEERYNASEKALQDMANREAGVNNGSTKGYNYKQTQEDNSDVEFIKKLDEDILKAKREGYDKATALTIEYGQKMAVAEKQGAIAVKKVKEWFWTEAKALDREQERETLKEKKAADDKKLMADYKHQLKKWEAETKWQERQQKLSGKTLAESLAETNKALEDEISLQLSLIDLKEKELAISPINAVTQRIGYEQELLRIQEETRDNAKAYSLEWYEAEKAVAATRNKLIGLKQVLKEQTGTQFEGYTYGLRDFVRHTRTAFQEGQELARSTAQAMSNAFSTFFIDAVEGKLKTFGDYVKAFLMDIYRAMAQIMAQRMTADILAGIFSGGGGAGGGGGDTGRGGIAIAHSGGLIMHSGGYVPRFHVGGLAADEVPAILQRGEYVVSRKGVAALDSINQGQVGGAVNVFVNVENRSSQPVNARTGGARFDGRQYIVGVVLDDIERGGPLRQAIGR